MVLGHRWSLPRFNNLTLRPQLKCTNYLEILRWLSSQHSSRRSNIYEFTNKYISWCCSFRSTIQNNNRRSGSDCHCHVVVELLQGNLITCQSPQKRSPLECFTPARFNRQKLSQNTTYPINLQRFLLLIYCILLKVGNPGFILGQIIRPGNSICVHSAVCYIKSRVAETFYILALSVLSACSTTRYQLSRSVNSTPTPRAYVMRFMCWLE